MPGREESVKSTFNSAKLGYEYCGLQGGPQKHCPGVDARGVVGLCQAARMMVANQAARLDS